MKKIKLSAWFSDFFNLFENTNFLILLLISFLVKAFLYTPQILYAIIDGFLFLVFISLYGSLKNSEGDLLSSFKSVLFLIPRIILVSLCILVIYIPIFILLGISFLYAGPNLLIPLVSVSLILVFVISLFISFVPYLIIIDDYSAVESIKKSYNLVKENFFKVLSITILNVIIAIPNFLFTFNNFLFSAYLTFYSALSIYLIYRLYILISEKRAKKYKQKSHSK